MQIFGRQLDHYLNQFATQGPIQLIVHLTFHGQWHLFQVPCQPLYSGGFACLGSPLKICKLQRCRCLSLRWQVIQFVLKSLHPRLRNTCTSAMYFKQCHESLSEKKTCFPNFMPLDTRAEFEFPTVHHAMPCVILLGQPLECFCTLRPRGLYM